MHLRTSPAALLLVAWSCGSFTAPGGTEEGFLPSGGVRLSYAIDFPAGLGPFPAFVLGHGSGRKTKSVHTDWARWLVARGVAVLRYDKRGVGESEGIYEDWGAPTSERMVALLGADMASAARFLADHPKVDPERVGLMGPSQAGWLIPLAARDEPTVRFAWIKSGPPVSVGLNVYFESLTADGRTIDEAEALLDGFQGFAGFNPAPVLRDLDIPIIWMLGGQDRNVPPRHSRTALETLIASDGRPITLIYNPDGDHGMAPDWEALGRWLEEYILTPRSETPP